MRQFCRAHLSMRSVPKNFVSLQGFIPALGSNLGPNAANLGPKPCTMTQNKARRTNKIDFLQLPWVQEVWSSNLHAPTNIFNGLQTLAFIVFIGL
jgi:hypothetical protein